MPTWYSTKHPESKSDNLNQNGYPGQQEIAHDPEKQSTGQPILPGYPAEQPGYPGQQGMQPMGQPYQPGYPSYPVQPGYYGQQGMAYDPMKQQVGPGVQGEND